MKKHKLGLLAVLFLFGLFIFNTNFVEALVPGCTSTTGYSEKTGEPCGKTITPPIYDSITVISPNGGETWEKGTTKTIKWKDSSTNSSIYNIYLKSLNAGEDSGWRLITLSASGNSYNWTIPNWSGNSQDPSPYEVPMGEYKIQICKHGTSVCDLSDDYFKIINTSATPSVTVLSPNGGEYFQYGKQQTISWKDSGYQRKTYNIILYANSGPTYVVAKNVAGFSFTGYLGNLAKDYNDEKNFAPPGTYGIQVCDSSTGICDVSDNYFTITSRLPIITPPIFDCKKGYDVNTGLRCGCTSTSGYSSYDGNSCALEIMPPIFECKNGYDVKTGFRCGCTSTVGYSSYDGNSCKLGSLPTGCTSTYGYSPTTGEICSGRAIPIPMPTPTPTPTVTCAITSTLRFGSTGQEVSCLQSRIGLISDGKFGPRTLIAVKAFQANAGLVADGIVGPRSISALEIAN